MKMNNGSPTSMLGSDVISILFHKDTNFRLNENKSLLLSELLIHQIPIS